MTLHPLPPLASSIDVRIFTTAGFTLQKDKINIIGDVASIAAYFKIVRCLGLINGGLYLSMDNKL